MKSRKSTFQLQQQEEYVSFEKARINFVKNRSKHCLEAVVYQDLHNQDLHNFNRIHKLDK